MPEAQDSARRSFWIVGIFLLIVAATNGVHVGDLPFYKEEPKRVIIAQEMLLSGDFMTPRIFQQPYYKKPPLHNWSIAASCGMDGLISNLEARLPSMVSLILMGVGMFVFLRRYAPDADEVIGTAAVTVNGLMLFEYARTAQPDILLALFCFASYAVFIVEPKNKVHLTVSALLMGAAVLTKGYGPVFFYPGLALHAFFCEEKPLKRLGRLLLHAALAMILPAAWAVAVILQNDMSSLVSTLQSEVMLRTSGRMGFFEHLAVFPPKFIYYLLPWSLLLPFIWKHIRWVSSPIFTSSAMIFATSFVLYWLLPGGKERYLLPAVPMLFVCMAHFFPKGMTLPWPPVRVAQGIVGGAIVVFCGFFAGRGYTDALWYMALPVVGMGAWLLYRGRRADLHLTALSLLLLLVFEHGYYQAKGMAGPSPEEAVATAAEAMPDPTKAWVVEHAFNSEILASTFACRTGRLPHTENIAKEKGLMQRPFYMWSQRQELPGCRLAATVAYEKEKRNPFYVLDCEGRK